MRIGEHAVVIGGSMGGLAAARVLADVYERVTLVDRDALPAGPAHRRGVPQGRHAHALIAGGREALEELFPGLTDEVEGLGAPTGDAGERVRWFQNGGRLAQAPCGLRGLNISRPLLEDRVRARVMALANVEAIDRADVVGLSTSEDGGGVTGIRIIRGRDGSAEERLAADLVVDASGRGSRTPRWLEGMGYPAPAEESVRVDVTYSTRVFRARPDAIDGDLAIVVCATPQVPRLGVLIALEDDRWIVSLAGYAGVRAPLELGRFLDYAASLANPDLAEALNGAEPLDEGATHRFPASVRRRYDRLRRFPAGLLVFGDALCSFNPIYGQGMTVAARQALALRDCLRSGPDGLPRRFFRRAAREIDAAWKIVMSSDLRLPAVEGARPRPVRVLNAYMARLLLAAQRDPRLTEAFLRVAYLVDRPERLLRPSVALRVLAGSPAGRRAAAAATAARSAPPRSVSTDVTPHRRPAK
jgi:2-polyprenyl-6-methoxyphenol hydroxylase-like FAD-dependent oxidoreductase